MAGRPGLRMLEAGAQAPEFELPGLAGQHYSLTEIASAGPVLIAFYKASCPVCQFTLPFLERLRPGGIRVLAVSQDDPQTTSEFFRSFRLTYDVAVDAKGYPASNAYGISSVPSLFQVEPDGRISRSWMGWSKAEMESLGERAGIAVLRANEQVPIYRPG